MNDPADVLHVVSVDDEEPARMALRQALDAVGGVIVQAECANGFEAVKAIGEARPDTRVSTRLCASSGMVSSCPRLAAAAAKAGTPGVSV